MLLLDILNPANRSEAGIVLFLILFGAAIIGFIVGWILRGLRSGKMDVSGLQLEIDTLKTDVATVSDEKNSLIAKNYTLQTDLEKCRSMKVDFPVENKEVELSNAAMNSPFLDNNISEDDKMNAERLGFRAVSGEKKDDLKRISGVGPFIEKKLNKLGIYTFDQISEFNGDTINKVTKAIEFFPGRIERDDWVSQAKEMKE